MARKKKTEPTLPKHNPKDFVGPYHDEVEYGEGDITELEGNYYLCNRYGTKGISPTDEEVPEDERPWEMLPNPKKFKSRIDVSNKMARQISALGELSRKVDQKIQEIRQERDKENKIDGIMPPNPREMDQPVIESLNKYVKELEEDLKKDIVNPNEKKA